MLINVHCSVLLTINQGNFFKFTTSGGNTTAAEELSLAHHIINYFLIVKTAFKKMYISNQLVVSVCFILQHMGLKI